MSPLKVLHNHYVGKKIVGGDLHPRYNGVIICNVNLASYDPIFEFGVKFPDGRVESVDVLEDWDIQVDPI
jgi:hypothetical protein